MPTDTNMNNTAKYNQHYTTNELNTHNYTHDDTKKKPENSLQIQNGNTYNLHAQQNHKNLTYDNFFRPYKTHTSLQNDDTHTNTHTLKRTAKHRSFTIDDEVDGIEMDPNLEEPLKAKMRREPSRQGA